MCFFRKNQAITILAPCSGKLIKLEDLNDQVFASKILGDGFVIVPSAKNFYAPMAGTLVTVFKTGHAIGIEQKHLQILLHIGLETVNLAGKGFKVYVKENQKVVAGELLVSVDLDQLMKVNKKMNLQKETPVVFLADGMKNRTIKMKGKYNSWVTKGDVIATVEAVD